MELRRQLAHKYHVIYPEEPGGFWLALEGLLTLFGANAAKGAGAATAAGEAGTAAKAGEAAGCAAKGASSVAGMVERNGFRFSQSYYTRLWNSGRKAPSLIAGEVLEGAAGKGVPDLVKPGFFRYEYGGWELIYNPTTREVWHLQPVM
ncbi:MAG: hypothetical protein IT427_19450 [Pirellulales bacterium]|nr:hypothetical protein [Pirellulales bacterium]